HLETAQRKLRARAQQCRAFNCQTQLLHLVQEELHHRFLSMQWQGKNGKQKQIAHRFTFCESVCHELMSRRHAARTHARSPRTAPGDLHPRKIAPPHPLDVAHVVTRRQYATAHSTATRRSNARSITASAPSMICIPARSRRRTRSTWHT